MPHIFIDEELLEFPILITAVTENNYARVVVTEKGQLGPAVRHILGSLPGVDESEIEDLLKSYDAFRGYGSPAEYSGGGVVDVRSLSIGYCGSPTNLGRSQVMCMRPDMKPAIELVIGYGIIAAALLYCCSRRR